MPHLISHSRPYLGKAEIDAAGRYLSRGELAVGGAVEAFERSFGQMHQGRPAIAVSSGSAALHLALLGLGIGRGDEVIVPSYVCAALLNAVWLVGARPKVADIELDDFALSPKALRQALGPRSKAVILVHMYGKPAKIDEIKAIARERRLFLIEDCAQAVGATYRGRPVGTFGDAAVFSFYATKVITTGHGGMVLVPSKTLARQIRDLRTYDKKLSSKLRFNYGMTDFQAALGQVQLRRLPSFIRQRRALAHRYSKALKPLALELPQDEPLRPSIYYRYVVLLPRASDPFIRAMKKRGVQCTKGVFKPLHRYLDLSPKRFPYTEEAMMRGASLPIYPGLTKEEFRRILDAAREAL